MGEFNSKKSPGVMPQAGDRSDWDILTESGPVEKDSFSGERNLNSATGEPRTFTEKDLYPQLENETNEAYEARLRHMHDKIAEYEAAEAAKEAAKKAIVDEKGFRTAHYEESDFGKKELESEAKFDRIAKKLDALVEKGVITEERANALLTREFDEAEKEIDAARQDYLDSHTVGTPEEKRAYEKWLSDRDQENQENLRATGRETPKASEVPKTSETPKTSVAPKTSETSESYETSKTATEASLDRFTENIERLMENGMVRAKYVEELSKRFAAIAARGATSVSSSSVEDEAKERAEAEQRSREEAEARARAEAEAEAETDDSELSDNPEETIEQKRARLAKINERIAELEKRLEPLTAVNANFTYDRRELAQGLAERALAAETAKAGLIKRIWKGKLFKDYFERKYEREFLEGKRKIKTEDGETDLNSLIRSRSDETIRRFVLGATDDMAYLHGGKNGETLTLEDKETETAIRSAIEEFASAKVGEGKTLEDLQKEFKSKMRKIQSGSSGLDRIKINNYLEVALQARNRVEHGISMGRVMGGFKAYRAEVRSHSENEAYLASLDNLLAKVEDGRIKNLIPEGSGSSSPKSESIDRVEQRKAIEEINAQIEALERRLYGPKPEVPEVKDEESSVDFAKEGQASFRKMIDEKMGTLVGKEGLDIMTMGGHYNGERDDERFANWWNGLSDEGKREVKDYYGDEFFGGWGIAFREWLRNQSELGERS